MLKDLVSHGHSDHHLVKPRVTGCVTKSRVAALSHLNRTLTALAPLGAATLQGDGPERGRRCSGGGEAAQEAGHRGHIMGREGRWRTPCADYHWHL